MGVDNARSVDNTDYMTADGTLIQVRKKLKDIPPVYIEATEPVRHPRPMSRKRGRSFSDKWSKVIATINFCLKITTRDINLDDESLDLYRHIYQAIMNKSRSFRSYRSNRAIQHATKLGLDYVAVGNDILVELKPEQIEALQVLVKNRVK